jgi:putative DNA primase/helicase
LWIARDASTELRPHQYNSYLTYVLDVAYSPQAICPEFDRTIRQIFERSSDPDDMVHHYQEFMGYTIQPLRDIACYFMMKGQGNNGKTKLIETIEKLISARCIFSGRLAEIEENRFSMGSLAGKLVLLDDDIDTGTKLPDGLLKKLSERKLLTGELKFKDSFEFVATCLPVLLANNFPLCADLSYGQRRRAQIIPFDRVFSPHEDDRALFPRIWRSELPGILNRAIEGLRRLRHRGVFLEPNDCVRARYEWLAQANPLVAFIAERCRAKQANHIPLTDFYIAFTQWAAEAGIRNVPARNTLRANLSNLGYPVRHTKHNSSEVFGLEVTGFYQPA